VLPFEEKELMRTHKHQIKSLLISLKAPLASIIPSVLLASPQKESNGKPK